MAHPCPCSGGDLVKQQNSDLHGVSCFKSRESAKKYLPQTGASSRNYRTNIGVIPAE